LSSIGKDGGLAGAGGRKVAPKTPRLSEEDQLEILRLLPDGIGNRDHLPYSGKFEEMHRRFEKLTKANLTKHQFWRAVSRVAKLSRKPKPLFASAPHGGLSAELVHFLERTNPWWKAQPAKTTKRFKRWAFGVVLSRLKKGIAPVVVVRGPRRVGKTTIQEQVIEHLLLIEHVGPQRILRVQFDDVPALGSLANPVETIVRWYEENVLKGTINASAQRGEVVYLLFDELQNIFKWSEQLKALTDHIEARTFVTGSSALRIAKGRDSLAGRMTPIELGPLRLSEIAGIRNMRDLPEFSPGASIEDWKNKEFWIKLTAHGQKYAKLRDEVFGYFSEYGGYPLCHDSGVTDINLLRRQIVGEVVTKTIESDSLHRPHKPALDERLVRETFRIVCRYAGQAVRNRTIAEEIAQVIQVGVTEAKVAEAIQFLVDSLLVRSIPPLEMLLKKNSALQKLCLCDHFVRSGVLQDTIPIAPSALVTLNQPTRTIAGHLVESIIGYFLKGIPDLDVAWWPPKKDEPEVDFILTIGAQRLPIEIKYTQGKPTRTDIGGIESFCAKKHYNAPFGLIVTQDTEGQLGDYTLALPASTFLLVG
jgi:predicted AAA+ superfamily ATPase